LNRPQAGLITLLTLVLQVQRYPIFKPFCKDFQ